MIEQKTEDDAAANNPQWRGHVLVALIIIGVATGIGFGIWQSRTNAATAEEHANWGPVRVAQYYADCLDLRYGTKPGLYTDGTHDARQLRKALKAGTITTQQVDLWLQEMQCPPLPPVAHLYQPPT